MVNKGSRRGRTRGRQLRSSSIEPPKVSLTPQCKMTFRFQAGSASSFDAIGSTDLVGLLGVATAATTVTSMVSAVRIRRLTIYAPAAAGGNTNSEIIWVGNQQRVDSRYNSATVGSALPSVTSSKPPPMSDCGKWIDGSVTAFTVCKLTFPAGAIVDLKVDIKLHNQIVYYSPVTYTGSSGLTAGYVYFGPLDRLANGALNSKLIPTGGVVYYG